MESDICSAKLAKFLDNPIRRLIHNPQRILNGLISDGDIAIDIGCGPGVFTTTMAQMVGDKGKVVAVDIQDEMLQMVKKNAIKWGLQDRIQLQKSTAASLCIPVQADFILTFYMVHEVPDKDRLFREIAAALKKGGTYLLVEPAGVHVSKKMFQTEVELALKNGLQIVNNRKVFLSKGVLFTR